MNSQKANKTLRRCYSVQWRDPVNDKDNIRDRRHISTTATATKKERQNKFYVKRVAERSACCKQRQKNRGKKNDSTKFEKFVYICLFTLGPRVVCFKLYSFHFIQKVLSKVNDFLITLQKKHNTPHSFART